MALQIGQPCMIWVNEKPVRGTVIKTTTSDGVLIFAEDGQKYFRHSSEVIRFNQNKRR